MKKHHTEYSGLDSLPRGNAGPELTPGCLVLEGGAFRGLYSEGVLDLLMSRGINLSCVIGTSAGALAGSGYVAGQIGRCARINFTYRHDSRYVGARALLRSGSPLCLDFILNDVNRTDPLDEARFYRPEQRFIAVAANCETGRTEYFEKGVCGDIMQAIKASASMPFISPMVTVDGKKCLDGGCTCKIPYEWALEQGFEKIVVIRTRERGYRKPAEGGMEQRAEIFYKKYPTFAWRLARSRVDYNSQVEEIERLERQGRIFCIAPSTPVTVGRLEKDLEALGSLYWQGWSDAELQLDALRAYLGLPEQETPADNGGDGNA